MKSIVAVLRPHVVSRLKKDLEDCEITGMTVVGAEGYGRQRGHTEVFRGAQYSIDCVPKVRVEVLVPDHRVEDIVAVIVACARTGRIGDGKIWITSVRTPIRIRTAQPDTVDETIPRP